MPDKGTCGYALSEIAYSSDGCGGWAALPVMLVEAHTIEQGSCFRKKGGEYVYLEDLEDGEFVGHADDILARLYDWADWNRVWLGP